MSLTLSLTSTRSGTRFVCYCRVGGFIWATSGSDKVLGCFGNLTLLCGLDTPLRTLDVPTTTLMFSLWVLTQSHSL